MVESYVKFVKAHEKLVLIVGACIVLFTIGSKWIDHSADVAIAKAAAAKESLEAQVKQNADFAAQVKAQSAQYVQLAASLETENRALVSAIAKRGVQETKQEKIDQVSPVANLAERWETLVNSGAGEIVPAGSGLLASDAASRATVIQLEKLPALQAQVIDQTVLIQNKDTELEGQTKVVAGLNTEVLGLNAQITKADSNCKAQVNEVKATARRGKRNWFLRGLGIGATVAAYLLR